LLSTPLRGPVQPGVRLRLPYRKAELPARYTTEVVPASLAQQRREMYCAIGEATTAWAAVEDQLADIFAYFVTGDGRSLSAKAAFHAVINFNSKLAMADDSAALRLALDGQLEKWQTLSNRLRLDATRKTVTKLFISRW
jgi:hypothetical protein